MSSIRLRSIDIDRDIARLVALFTLVQDEPTNEQELKLAIDRKFGYTVLPGEFVMVKDLE